MLPIALRGIAHEFNNLLTVIEGNVDLLLLRPRPRAPDALLGEIKVAVELGTCLTRQLLTPDQTPGRSRDPTDLHVSIRTVAPLLRRLIGPASRLRLELHADRPLVRIEHGLIGQILVNLALNARDAMPDGGRLLVRTTLTGTPAAPATSGDPVHGFVLVQVADTGVGMPPGVAARAFDPLFTTRPGRRAGLGLALVGDAVRRNGGEIRLTSRPGHGTTFSLTFRQLATPTADRDEDA